MKNKYNNNINYNDEEENKDNNLLNKNILNNRLICNYLKKEKEIKKLEKKKKKEKEKAQQNQEQQKYTNNNNIFKNYIDTNIQNKKDRLKMRNDIELKSDSNIQSSLFKDINKSSENMSIYSKYNNNILINKEKTSSNIENEEMEEKENSNIIEGTNQLKEVSFKIILNEKEYSLLIQEKAKNINHSISNYM